MEKLDNNKKVEYYEKALEYALKATDGDFKKVAAFCSNVVSQSNFERKDKNGNKRYITAVELNYLISAILSGLGYEDALELVSDELFYINGELEGICNTLHNKVILNSNYKQAEENREEFKEFLKPKIDKIVKSGVLQRSDYKSKVRPKYGLNRIAKAVKVYNMLENKSSDIKPTKPSKKKEIESLLLNGLNVKEITEKVDCTRNDIYNAKKRLNRRNKN